jgi:mono/diheme cytochrome c family protein
MRRPLAQAALAGALCLAGASLASAQSTGQEEFQRHCALCHGLDGRGDGPLAQAMKLAPTDLTRLSANNNGEFPSNKVSDVIRNGGNVLGHGSSAMLPWGTYFAERGEPKVGKEWIAALVGYIKSLQQK